MFSIFAPIFAAIKVIVLIQIIANRINNFHVTCGNDAVFLNYFGSIDINLIELKFGKEKPCKPAEPTFKTSFITMPSTLGLRQIDEFSYLSLRQTNTQKPKRLLYYCCDGNPAPILKPSKPNIKGDINNPA